MNQPDAMTAAIAQTALAAATEAATRGGNPYDATRHAERLLLCAWLSLKPCDLRAALLRNLDEVILNENDPATAADWWEGVAEAAQTARTVAIREAEDAA